MNNLSLLPQPRALTLTPGHHTLKPDKYILLDAPQAGQHEFSALWLKNTLREYGDVAYMLSASVTGPARAFGVVLRQVEDPAIPDQGYRLSITPERITVEANAPAGIFYGVQTLTQVIKQSGQALPCLEISDWPDFPARGYMLDISRDKVPTMATLLELIDRLAEWKINQVQLYTEHTFAYLNHPEVWREATPMTGQDILELDRYCKERFIELVPNQNSFGHMNRWLTNRHYAPLAEVAEEFSTPWGYETGPFSLNPTDPASFELVKSLYDELLPHFSSRQVNIGCDETFDLGQGRSRELVEQIGKYRVYLDFLLKVSNDLIGRGYTVQFWGDIVQEEPEVIPLLPKGLLALDWGYEETHPFDLECSRFKASGIPFYVCPGISTWCSIGGRTKNALGNLLNAAEAGLKYGASGFLNTDWGDRGHWQTLPISYLGIAVGAAYSWALDANRNLDVVDVLNRFAFEDAAGVMGKLAYDLGEVYRLPGLARGNSSQLFWILQYTDEQLAQAQRKSNNYSSPDDMMGRLNFVEDAVLQEALSVINRILEPLEASRMAGEDAALVKREFAMAARMMRLSCQRALLAGNPAQFRAKYTVEIAGIINEYKQIWLARNRPGGLKDSILALERLQG